MPRNLLLFIIDHAERGITRYKCREDGAAYWICCWSFRLRVGIFETRSDRSGEDREEVRTSGGKGLGMMDMWFWIENIFGMEGSTMVVKEWWRL